jgi:hypothetical protein
MLDQSLFEQMKESGSKLPEIIETLKKRGWVNYKHHDNWIHPKIIGEYDTHIAYHTIIIDVDIAASLAQLRKALTTNADYWQGWQANIAMSIYDEYVSKFPDVNPLVKNKLLEIFSNGADRFLKLLTAEKTTENA